MLLENQLHMGWGAPWRAALSKKAVAATFSMWVISEDGNKEDVNSLQVISAQLEVSGEVVLGYFFFSWLAALVTEPKRNLVGIRVFAPLHQACRVGEQAQLLAVQVRPACVEGPEKGYMARYGL